MWGRGRCELDKYCSMMNLQEFGQWLFLVSHVFLVMSSLLRKGFSLFSSGKV